MVCSRGQQLLTLWMEFQQAEKIHYYYYNNNNNYYYFYFCQYHKR